MRIPGRLVLPGRTIRTVNELQTLRIRAACCLLASRTFSLTSLPTLDLGTRCRRPSVLTNQCVRLFRTSSLTLDGARTPSGPAAGQLIKEAAGTDQTNSLNKSADTNAVTVESKANGAKDQSKGLVDTNANVVEATTNEAKDQQKGLADFLDRAVNSKSDKASEKDAKDQAKGGLAELKRIVGLARPEAAMISGAVVLLFVSSGVTMSVPYFIGKIIDVMSSPDLTLPYPWIAAVFVAGAAANAGRVFLMQYSGARIVARLRSTLYSSLMSRPLSFLDKQRTGELISRLSTDVQIMSRVATQNISDGLRSVVTTLVGGGMLFAISPKLMMIMAAIVPFLAVAARFYGRFVRSLSKKTQEALAHAVEEAEEKLSNVRTVRSFGREALETSRFDTRIAEILRLAKVETIASASFFSMAGLSGNFTILAVLYFGSNMVHTGAISVGELTSFLLYTAYVGGSLMGLGSFYTDMMRGLGASTRVFGILDEPQEIPKGSVVVHPDTPAAVSKGLLPRDTNSEDTGVTVSAPLVSNTGTTGLRPKLAGHIEFKNVAFTYPTRNSPIFTDISFSVPAGTVVGVMGESGGGKSTISALLLRLYDPDGASGTITIDGYDIRTLDPTWYRQEVIAVVAQEPTLFVGTVLENIRYGRLDATDEEVLDAARQANCFEFVEAFPDKWQTKLGERGVNLSGGQRQRIAIARAILRNPRILVLDEASSNLDSLSESLVQAALERLMKGRTVIMIAHRLTTLTNCDKLLVIQKGTVADSGTWNELMGRPETAAFRVLVAGQAGTPGGIPSA